VTIFKLDNGIVTEANNFQSDHTAVAKFWS
jgi:hypothetical protein